MNLWAWVALSGAALLGIGTVRAVRGGRLAPAPAPTLGIATAGLVAMGVGYALTGSPAWERALDVGTMLWLGVLAMGGGRSRL